jgi:hypothetical protein
MENYCGSVKGPPYAPIIEHDLLNAGRSRKRGAKGDFSLNNYFVYSSANALAPVTSAGKFYDVGNFQVATSGNAVTTEIGELYVEYSFTMIRPKQQTPLGQNLIAAHVTSSTGLSTTDRMGTVQTNGAGTTLLLTWVPSTSTFTIPTAGRYLVSYGGRGTVMAATADFVVGTGATLVNSVWWGQNTNALLVSGWISVDIAQGGGAITLPTFTATTFTSAELYVSQIPSGLTLAE